METRFSIFLSRGTYLKHRKGLSLKKKTRIRYKYQTNQVLSKSPYASCKIVCKFGAWKNLKESLLKVFATAKINRKTVSMLIFKVFQYVAEKNICFHIDKIHKCLMKTQMVYLFPLFLRRKLETSKIDNRGN